MAKWQTRNVESVVGNRPGSSPGEHTTLLFTFLGLATQLVTRSDCRSDFGGFDPHARRQLHQSMIPKNGDRFSEKIMLQQ
jgi:hypothetical protein